MLTVVDEVVVLSRWSRFGSTKAFFKKADRVAVVLPVTVELS